MLGLLVLGLLLRSVGLVAVTVQPSRSLRGGSARYGPLVATGVAGPGGTGRDRPAGDDPTIAPYRPYLARSCSALPRQASASAGKVVEAALRSSAS